MNIRPFDEKDRSAVIALWRACELVKPQNNPDRDIDRKLAVGRELFLVAERGGEIIASVMAGYEGHRGWINYLAVAPTHRRQGLGETMMAAAEQVLRAAGCPKINLQIRDSNLEVIAFYRAIGYLEDPVKSMGKRLESDQ